MVHTSPLDIPTRRTRRNTIRFGFVRFWNRGDAIKSIFMLNNATITGKKILGYLARTVKRRIFRPHRHQSRRAPNISKSWIKKEQKQGGDKKVQLVRFSQENQYHKKFLKGQVNLEFEDWLNRSLVCTSDEPRDLASLASTIINGYGQCMNNCIIFFHLFFS